MCDPPATRAALIEAITQQLATSAGTPDELAALLGARTTLVRSVLAELYFHGQTVVSEGDGRHHLRGGATAEGVGVVGFDGPAPGRSPNAAEPFGDPDWTAPATAKESPGAPEPNASSSRTPQR